MEQGAHDRFDLEKAIAAWRQFHERQRVFLPEDLDELERHLRDHTAHLVGSGLTRRDAFEEAVEVLGDLDGGADEYRKVYRGKLKRNRTRADEWRWKCSMLRNYLVIALRNARRHAGYTFINVVGLAVGLACCLLIGRFLIEELSYDTYHERADRIYRMVHGDNANTPQLWAPALEDAFPEVEQAVRILGGFSRALVTYDEQHFKEPGGYYSDADVFQVFNWPLAQGDPQTALSAPYTVVLTASMARKYFGSEDPIGKVLTIGGMSNDPERSDYTVTGILDEIPPNSHIRFDYLLSYKTIEVLDEAGRWGTPLSWTNNMTKTYVLLANQADPNGLENGLPGFLRSHIPSERYNVNNARLQPLTDIHLYSNLRSEFEPGGTITYVYLFSVLAGFILLIACINFMNLATARSQQRAGEVGMRKALGARRTQLIGQFLGESVLLSLFALGLSLILVWILLPAFSALIDKPQTVSVSIIGPLLGGAFLFALLVGGLAGSYPALVLSAFGPIQAFRGERIRDVRGNWFRKGLVVFQFTVSIVLIIGTLIVLDQVDYLHTKDLGFEQEQLVVMPIGHSENLRPRANLLKQAIAQHPTIVSVSASHSLPSQFLNNFAYRPVGAATEDRINLRDVSVDHDLLDTFGVRVVAGRTFSVDRAGDSTAFVLNESAVRQLGWNAPDEALGQQLEWVFPMGFQGPVIGVVEDFHFGSLHDPIAPIVFHISRFGSNFVTARVQPERVAETLDFLKETWSRYETEYPFEYFFVDEEFAGFYEAESRLGLAFGYGSGLAILIACLGLFGLTAYTVERRKKEIGIRKVLGASVGSVVSILSRDILILVAVAFVTACPLAFLGMSEWLAGFPYRTDIGAGVFILAGALALCIAALTVGFQSVKAALADPVQSIRYE